MTPDWMTSPLTPDDILLRELEDRERAHDHIAHYARRVLGIEAAQHHLLIYDYLERMVLGDEFDDLIINTPPGSAKSTTVSQAFPSWFLGRFPDKNVIIASHTATLAEKWSRKSRDTVANPEHSLIFEASALSRDATSVSRWITTKGGECLAAGVGMAILGMRADVVVIDDALSGWEQASSMTQLQKVHDWFKSDLKSRLKPRAKIVHICQRLSANDLAGFMIAEHAENPTRRLKTLILPMVADSTDDPLGRALGERLWSDWFTEEMVKDLQKDDFIWRTMWQQQPPSDTGSWVSMEEVGFRPTPEVTPDTPIYACSDLALSVNSGDYTVHFIVAINSQNEWDIIDASRERVDPDASASTIVKLCETYHPNEWLIDDDNASKVFMPLVATKAKQTSTFVPWRPMPMRGQDKETRAAALRGQFKRRRVFMPKEAPFTRWLLNEILGFPNLIGQGVDDGIDALSCLGRRLASIASKAPDPVAAKPAPTMQQMTLNDLFEDREHRRAGRARL